MIIKPKNQFFLHGLRKSQKSRICLQAQNVSKQSQLSFGKAKNLKVSPNFMLDSEQNQSLQKNLLKIGSENTYNLKITSLASNNIGIDEYTYGFRILIINKDLNASVFKIGDIVKAKIVKIKYSNQASLQKKIIISFAIAKSLTISSSSKNQNNTDNSNFVSTSNSLKVGSFLTLSDLNTNVLALNTNSNNQSLKIEQKEKKTELVLEQNSMKPLKKIFIVNLFEQDLSNDQDQDSIKNNKQVEIFRIKNNYAFAKFINNPFVDNITSKPTYATVSLSLKKKTQIVKTKPTFLLTQKQQKQPPLLKKKNIVSKTKTIFIGEKKNWTWKKSSVFNKTVFSFNKDVFYKSTDLLNKNLTNFFLSMDVNKKRKEEEDSIVPMYNGNSISLKAAPENANSVSLNGELKYEAFIPGKTSLEQEAKNKYLSYIPNKKAKNVDSITQLSNNATNLGFIEPISLTSENLKTFIGNLQEGLKLTLILPEKVKRYTCLPNHVAFKLGQTLIFVKLSLGANLGMRVKLQLTKVFRSNMKMPKFVNSDFISGCIGTQVAIAKVIELNPSSFSKKRLVLKNAVSQMLNSGMHFGEKAIKCHPRMKNYVWFRQKGQNKNKPYIKKGRNIINLLRTQRCMNQTLFYLGKYAAKQRTFLFVGTKKPAAALITRASLFSKNSFFVNTRWLGGMLTNWKTILKSISKIRPILIEKQAIIKEILTKRQNLKKRLIEKALLLKKKSKLLLKKGKTVLNFLQMKSNTNSGTLSNGIDKNGLTSVQQPFTGVKQPDNILKLQENNQKLLAKTDQWIHNTENLLQIRVQLLKKRQALNQQSSLLKKKSDFITHNYKNLLNRILIHSKKITELKSLFVIAKQIQKLKKKNILTVNYAQFKSLAHSLEKTVSSDFTLNENQISTKNFLIPNPPQDILNKIILVIRSTSEFSKNKDVSLKTSAFFNIKKSNNSTEFYNANQKVILMSRLLSKFSMFVPYIRECINTTFSDLEQDMTLAKKIKTTLITIKKKFILYLSLKNSINVQLQQLKTNILIQRQKLNYLKRTLKQISAEIRLLKFLPKLRFLSALPNSKNFFSNPNKSSSMITESDLSLRNSASFPSTGGNGTQVSFKLYDVINILMKKVVDPKLRYPMHLIYDQKLSLKSKKIIAARKKTWQRLEKYFGGIANMTKMKKKNINKNVAIIIGQQEEQNAVRECKKLGIKMFHIVDTNCNPTLADHFIPANDDSRNSIKYILTKFLTRIRLAQKININLKYKKRF